MAHTLSGVMIHRQLTCRQLARMDPLNQEPPRWQRRRHV